MSFLYPYVLIALLLPLLLAVTAVVSRHRTRRSWQLLTAPAHRRELVRRPPLWRTILPPILGLLALSLCILAAARPINGYTESGAVSSGRNLIIALDVSRSMETTDVTPSRLEEARTAAYELINALPTDKIGLIIFSGEADLIVPLTYDHEALKETLYNVNRDWVPTGGTNFGLVLRRAMKDFERSAPDGTNALVILSDGEDTMETSADIAAEARKNKLLVITVGIGTSAGGAIPDPRGQNGLWQDANGKHVISKLHVDKLREFAQATGGDFFTMDSGANLAAFARETANKLDRHEESFSATKVPNDLFCWFALPALVLLIGAILLSTEWRRSTRVTPLLALSLLAATPHVQAAPTELSVQAYTRGIAHMQEGSVEEARKELSQALLDEDPALQTASLHALGNIAVTATLDDLRRLYHAPTEAPSPDDAEEEEAPATGPAQVTPEALQKIVDALRTDIRSYQDALAITPDFAPARQNIEKINELIKKLEEEIERLRQQQQDNQQQDDQQQDNQQQDNQQQDDQQQDDQQQDDQQQDNQQQDDQQQDDPQQDAPQQDDPQQDAPQQDDQQQDDRQQDNQQQDNQQQDDQQQDDQQQDNQQQDDQQQDDQQQDDQHPSVSPLSEKEKAQQRAAGILRMHLDEEKGSPIPHRGTVPSPEKDY